METLVAPKGSPDLTTTLPDLTIRQEYSCHRKGNKSTGHSSPHYPTIKDSWQVHDTSGGKMGIFA
jgi:hypothetical protein